MRWLTGTATTTGQISTTNLTVLAVEFHARIDNIDSIAVGASDVSITNGREIGPGGTHSLNFEPGSIPFTEMYVAIKTGGDKLDWSIIVST